MHSLQLTCIDFEHASRRIRAFAECCLLICPRDRGIRCSLGRQQQLFTTDRLDIGILAQRRDQEELLNKAVGEVCSGEEATEVSNRAHHHLQLVGHIVLVHHRWVNMLPLLCGQQRGITLFLAPLKERFGSL